MISVKGKIEKGKILALEPVDEAFEGKEVTITFDEKPNGGANGNKAKPSRAEIRHGWERLLKTIKENQIETDITDMAHQHDHYLYGTPKRED